MSRIPWAVPFAAAVAVVSLGLARAAEVPLPEVTRTDESRFVHRIELMDEKGNAIGPTSVVPYSPKMTCTSSKCHTYDTIARGTHSRAYPSLKPVPYRADRFVWTQFDGVTGMAAPLSHGSLAAKPEEFDPKAHMTAYELALRFGAYHVGGGRMELDAAGNRYDTHLAANVALRTAAEPTASPDYFQARWDQTGVIENDCMACHALKGYDHVERAGQIASWNFRWAATVGAGFGVVEGKTASLGIPEPDAKPDESVEPAIKVSYDPALFGPDGKVHLEIGKPPDANCLFCHRRPAKGEADWTDCLDADVHSKAGLKCVDCHRAGADHVIAGDRRAERADFYSLTCKGCHSTGRLGAPVAAHNGLPRLHLDDLSCEACHAGPRPRVVPLAIERPIDPTWSVLLSSRKASGPTTFAPVYTEPDGGPIGVSLRLLPTYYANRRPDKTLVPLEPSYVSGRFRRAASEIKDDDGDGSPEINTEAEIKAMLKALKKKDVSPAYIAGGRVYEADDKGELKSEPEPLGDPLDNPLAHNVRPAPQALGAQGCTECHSSDSPFFRSLALTQAMGADGKPQGTPLFTQLGKSEFDLRLAAFRERYVRFYGPIAIGLVAGALVLHYVLFGPRRYKRRVPDELVQRFNVVERLAHLVLLGSFAATMATGMLNSMGIEAVAGIHIEPIHDLASWALLAGAALALLLWARDMVFSKLDIKWVKVLGGHLGYKGRVPAGRFNAGQKAFFWFILLGVACLTVAGLAMRYGVGGDRWSTLAYTAYIIGALLMIVCVTVHIYLVAFANPGTLGGVFNGKVEQEWLAHHHPDYTPKGEEKKEPHA